MNRIAKYHNYPTTAFSQFSTMPGIDLFKELFSGFSYDPLKEVIEKIDGGIQISLAVPGVEADKIDVTATNDILRFNIVDDRQTYSRSWKIPQDVISAEISAELKNGILKVILPVKKEEPRRITIIQ